MNGVDVMNAQENQGSNTPFQRFHRLSKRSWREVRDLPKAQRDAETRALLPWLKAEGVVTQEQKLALISNLQHEEVIPMLSKLRESLNAWPAKRRHVAMKHVLPLSLLCGAIANIIGASRDRYLAVILILLAWSWWLMEFLVGSFRQDLIDSEYLPGASEQSSLRGQSTLFGKHQFSYTRQEEWSRAWLSGQSLKKILSQISKSEKTQERFFSFFA